jgi:hypothetical protein
MVMLRKTIVALFAIASIGMLVPDVASARGGFGGGGFRGGGGFHGGGFRAGGIGMGGAGFRAAAIGPGFRSAGPVGFRAAGPVGFRGGTLAANSFRGGYFRPGFRRGFPYAAAAVVGAGLAYGAGYYDDSYYYGGYPYYPNYPYDIEGNYVQGAGYYPDGGCYVVRQRFPTPYGWVLRPIQVCN